jgi:hypothetical protein
MALKSEDAADAELATALQKIGAPIVTASLACIQSLNRRCFWWRIEGWHIG